MTRKRAVQAAAITAEIVLVAVAVAGLWVGLIMANDIINSIGVHPY